MLQGYPTKNGTGIAILGDYGDLTSLYETVHEISNTLDEFSIQTKGQYQLLMNLAYEIRKAYSGQRLIEKFKFDGDDHELHYFGFKVVWTDILIFIATLRHTAGYIRTNNLHQANLYMLEYVVERELSNYDKEGTSLITDSVERIINISNHFCFIIYQAIHIKFVAAQSGKKRFRNIPNLIANHFLEWKPEYKELIQSFELSAKQQNCDITDLEFNDFPDIKW
jgi:hypothetical protein